MHPKRRSILAGVLALVAIVCCAAGGAATSHPHPFHDDLGLIPWRASWQAAQQEAKATGKPIYIEFSKEGCGEGGTFAAETLPDKTIRDLLRRPFVCVVLDFDRKPPQLQDLCKVRNLVHPPVNLFLTASGEFLAAHQRMVRPPEFERTLRAVLADPRVATAKGKERDFERLALSLAQALEAKDGKKVQLALQAVEKIPGLSAAKERAYAVLDEAEMPVWDKLADAAKLARANNYPLARVALEEAVLMSEHLPVSRDVQAALAALPLFEEASAAEAAKEGKWKDKAAGEYQKVLARHSDSMLAVLAKVRLRALMKTK